VPAHLKPVLSRPHSTPKFSDTIVIQQIGLNSSVLILKDKFISKCAKKVETFFAGDRIYLSKGAAGHVLVKSCLSLVTLFQSAKTNKKVLRPKGKIECRL
jgi:hypothetical protein